MATIYTIGHSTRSLSELADMLQDIGVRLLVDVRTCLLSCLTWLLRLLIA
jgi:uncharacterized protein (DUF488 family)